LTFKESQYFLLPMLRLAGVPGFTRGDVHTLAQLFVEVTDEGLSPYTIHLQAYTYNDLFEAAIRGKLGALAKVFPWGMALQRLYLFQGYLHSEDSPVIEARLVDEVLRLSAKEKPETGRVLDRVVSKLAGLRTETGLVPLGRLMRRGEPGRGFHVGGSFPMVAGTPQRLESDTLGRVAGMKRVHLVDASVLPSIAATTITFTVMANAHRIGSMVGAGADS
jgi:choline dehydrogenase-like flavoprotein